MKNIFLGPVSHWILLVVLCTLGWFAGKARFHVTSFNVFLICLIVLVIAMLALVIMTSRAGVRITREPIDDEADNLEK